MTNYLLERPKEIFFNYATSKFQMMRDGLHEEYLSYNVTIEQEIIWTNELIDRELSKLNIVDINTLFPLSYVLQSNCLTKPLDKIIDFIRDNAVKTANRDKVVAFISKTHDIIVSFDENCKRVPVLTEHYKRRLADLKY